MGVVHCVLNFLYYFICHCTRASDISWKKKQNFAGFSGANSQKNRPISRDFCGKKVKIRGKSADFAGFSREKSQNSRKIGQFRRIFAGEKSKFAENWPISQDFRGRKVKIRRKIGRFCGILAEKSQITKDFHGQSLRKIGRFHRKFRGETLPRNNQ